MVPFIYHVDVNSAYLSWTAIDKLNKGAEIDLRLVPSIIGGDQKSRHGVVLAKSMLAKKHGIQTGEPVVNAFRKCPNLRMESPEHRLYEEYSQQLMAFLRTYTSEIEQVSVDECFMDLTGHIHSYKAAIEVAKEIKDAVYKKFGFTVNIGISSKKVLAKMASDFEKPNLVHTLFPEEIQEKMWMLPVNELYMAGKSSVLTLQKLEIKTIGDLAKTSPDILRAHLKSHGQLLWEYANGIDTSMVTSEKAEVKGIGNSTTLTEDVVELEEAKRILRYLADRVSGRLRKARQKSNIISVEIKYHTFQTASHQCQMGKPSNTNELIYKTACLLFEELWTGEPIRLIGIRSSKLVGEDEAEQLSLFDSSLSTAEVLDYKQTDEKYQRLDRAMDEIRKKFGRDAVKRGSSL